MRCLLFCVSLAACQAAPARICDSRPDVVDPCGGPDGGDGPIRGTPDPGSVPSGRVDANGGTVDRLWFATTGDTRPAECDQTNLYPKAAIAGIAFAMRALRVQFTVDLGDHMYVCNQSDAEARQQMSFYMEAVAQGPPAWWMTMGNHECGSDAYPFACFVNGGHDANFAAFQTVSGDNHPIHYDIEYCRRQGHPGLLAHGFQVLAQTAAGAGIFPHVVGESLIGFIEQSCRFLKPVYSGDTVYPLLTVAALTPGRKTGVITVRSTVHNQRRELCMEGEQKYLVRKRHPGA